MASSRNPILLLFVAPALALVVIVIGLAGMLKDGMLMTILSVACTGLAIATSIVSARRISRDWAERPPGSLPNLQSTGGTIVLALVFFAMQAMLCCVMFFVGCLLMVGTARGGL